MPVAQPAFTSSPASADEAVLFGKASRLHDVGKIGISDAILRKPGKLDDEELRVMRQHPEIGARIIGDTFQALIGMLDWNLSAEAALDLPRLEREGYLVPAQARSQLAEQMRIIKRPLLANARGRVEATLITTSLDSGDGRSAALQETQR